MANHVLSYSLKDAVEALHGETVAQRRRRDNLLVSPDPAAMRHGASDNDNIRHIIATPVVLVLGMTVFALAVNAAVSSLQSSVALVIPSSYLATCGRAKLLLAINCCVLSAVAAVRGPAEWVLAIQDITERTRGLRARVGAAPFRWFGGLWAVVFSVIFLPLYFDLLAKVSAMHDDDGSAGSAAADAASRAALEQALIKEWLSERVASLPHLFFDVFAHTMAILMSTLTLWPAIARMG